MLNNTLNTNEIKNAAGTEVEFTRLRTEGRETVFAQIAETPALEHRLTIKHQETGASTKRRRRSLVRIDKDVVSGYDPTVTVTVSAYMVLDAPVGAMSSIAEATNAIAELISFTATTGAATTVLFDGTGNGSKALLEGSL